MSVCYFPYTVAQREQFADFLFNRSIRVFQITLCMPTRHFDFFFIFIIIIIFRNKFLFLLLSLFFVINRF